MLPDFPEVKAHLRAVLFRWAQQQLPQLSPLLGEIGRIYQHEGQPGSLTRADGSTEPLDYSTQSFEFDLTRDEMKHLDLDGLMEKYRALAEQMAAAQSRLMFQKISEAASSVGNTVSAEGQFRREHFLDLISRVEMEFDTATGEPTGQSFIMHPDTAAKIIPLMEEWESDPAFIAEQQRIINAKREEWRVRENRRRLVD
jgi:hypothetical protein